MEAYGETPGDVMVFSAQDNAPLFGTAGARLSTAYGEARLKAQAQATFNDDVLDANRSLTAARASAPVSLAMPVTAPATEWTDLRLSLTAEAGPGLAATLTGGALLQGETGTTWYGNLGVTARF